jgi:hypothetical protein
MSGDALEAVTKADYGLIDVRIVPSEADLRALVRADPQRPYFIIMTILSRLGAAALSAGLTAMALWFWDQLDASLLQDYTKIVAGGLAGVLAFRLLVEQKWKRRVRIVFSKLRPFQVTSDGKMLTTRNEHTVSQVALSGIDRLLRTPTHLILFKDRAPFLAMPRSAFDKPETLDAFAAFLDGMRASASDQATRQTT